MLNIPTSVGGNDQLPTSIVLVRTLKKQSKFNKKELITAYPFYEKPTNSSKWTPPSDDAKSKAKISSAVSTATK